MVYQVLVEAIANYRVYIIQFYFYNIYRNSR
jgi:hypothetical protein